MHDDALPHTCLVDEKGRRRRGYSPHRFIFLRKISHHPVGTLREQCLQFTSSIYSPVYSNSWYVNHPYEAEKWFTFSLSAKVPPGSQLSGSDVAGVFYDHVFNHMPAHLLHIDNSGVHLINRDDLHHVFRPEHATEEEIALRMAKLPNRTREEVIRNLVAEKLHYAILSHRWSSEGEVTFQMVMENGLDGDSPGYAKLRKFCVTAEALGCKLAWADTCCIDKTSSAELDEAIRSMFKWYRNSAVCIVLLVKATAGQTSIRDDPWFTRGWTLQELLAPPKIKFYSADWVPLSTFSNDKKNTDIMHIISEITGIDRRNLRYFSPGLLNVREKMLWASTRKTTRVEDVAYSLLGIFDISMPIAYGEGKRAFRRLMEVIVNECREWQIFAWAGPHSPYATSFPESPSGYRALTDATAALMLSSGRLVHRPWDRVGYPFYAMTKKGLELEVLLVEVMLHIHREPVEGTTCECLTLSPGSENKRFFENIQVVCDTRFLLFSQWAAGIINYQTDGAGNREGMAELETGREYICFFLGKGIYSPYGKWEKVETKEVVTIHTKEVLRRRVTTVWL